MVLIAMILKGIIACLISTVASSSLTIRKSAQVCQQWKFDPIAFQNQAYIVYATLYEAAQGK